MYVYVHIDIHIYIYIYIHIYVYICTDSGLGEVRRRDAGARARGGPAMLCDAMLCYTYTIVLYSIL